VVFILHLISVEKLLPILLYSILLIVMLLAELWMHHDLDVSDFQGRAATSIARVRLTELAVLSLDYMLVLR